MFNSKIEVGGHKKLLEAYKNALEPESDFKNERGSYKLSLKENKLIISVKANDATAFRAVMNSITELIALVEKTWKIHNGDE